MDNPTVDLGTSTPVHPDPSLDRSAGRSKQQQMGDQTAPKSQKVAAHAAMSQQGSDIGRSTDSRPQKLVQLVGYRAPDAGGGSSRSLPHR